MGGPRLVSPHFDEHEAERMAEVAQPGMQGGYKHSREGQHEAMLEPLELDPDEDEDGEWPVTHEPHPLNRILVAPSESWRTGWHLP